MMIIQVGGNRLARVVADDRHAAAGLASCRNEFRCPVGGHSRKDTAYRAVEVEQQVTGAADDLLELGVGLRRGGHGWRPTVCHTVSDQAAGRSTHLLALG